LVALSDQTEIQKLRESDMEISDANSETATIVIKKEDEPIIFKKKSIDPLPSPEPTKFSGVVPKPLPDAESLVTGADRAEPERANHPHLSDEQGNVHTPANHATRLLVPTDGNSQPTINYRQPLLDLPIAGNKSFHPALADVKTFNNIVNRLNYVNEYAKLKIDDSTIERLAILWRLLMDPNYSAAICMTAREVYNNQVGDLVEVLRNVLSLRWDSQTTTQPGGNIDQLVIVTSELEDAAHALRISWQSPCGTFLTALHRIINGELISSLIPRSIWTRSPFFSGISKITLMLSTVTQIGSVALTPKE
jgi:hypothetical protein